jgi:hypothetical protein
MSTSPTKNLIFLHDSQNNFKFLVDSGASISILPHSSSAPPTGPHLVGANGKTIPSWEFCRFTVCFSGKNFEFNFLLAAVATPLLCMDFVHILACLLSPQNSRFCTLHLLQDKYFLFYNPMELRDHRAAAVATL